VSGSLASHYAPATPLRLADVAQLPAVLAQALAAGQRVALWSPVPPPQPDPRIRWHAQPGTVVAMEHELYRLLRELDAEGADLILVQSPPDGAAWAAVNDRLHRAATPPPGDSANPPIA
jgi:L-threonylcarbamoyladenylate synthase